MPSIDNQVEELEQWIALNECKGGPSVFKLMCIEPELEGVFTISVDGLRYGKFGLYLRKRGDYCVTHLRTGRQCGELFSSEKDARRMIFCISGLTDWTKVEWLDNRSSLGSELLVSLRQASEYCHGGEAGPELIETVTKLLPIDEDNLEYEIKKVEFGKAKPKVVSQPKRSGGWGLTVT